MSIREILEKLQKKTQSLMMDVPYEKAEEKYLIEFALSAIKSELKEKIGNEKSNEDEKGLYGDALRTSRRDKGIRNETLSQILKIIEEA
jgi:hypothetical protein